MTVLRVDAEEPLTARKMDGQRTSMNWPHRGQTCSLSQTTRREARGSSFRGRAQAVPTADVNDDLSVGTVGDQSPATREADRLDPELECGAGHDVARTPTAAHCRTAMR